MKVILNIRLDEEVKEKLRIISKKNSRSMAKQVEHFILEYEKKEKDGKK